MAPRKRQILHPDEVKQKIRTTQLLNRLQNHALFEDWDDEPKKRRTIMTGDQIRAASLLLAKTLPDLKAVDHSGEVSVTVSRRTIYESKPDFDDD